MKKLTMTGKQLEIALDFLRENKGMSGNAFCRRCNVSSSSQTYWRKAGIGGSAAVILHKLLGKQWSKIKSEVNDGNK